MVSIKFKHKKLEGDLKTKLCGKRLYPTESIKYLGVKIDKNVIWWHYINDFSIKLNRANAFLFKMRKILRSIYFAIFDSYLSYCCLAWAHNFSTIQRILILQKRLFIKGWIINFQPKNFHTSPLFKQNSILKFQNEICLENILFVSKSLNNLSLSIFNTWFRFSSDQHNYENSSSTQSNLMKLFYQTNRYGKCSIAVSAAELWSKIQKQLKHRLLKDLFPNKIKIVVTNFF